MVQSIVDVANELFLGQEWGSLVARCSMGDTPAEFEARVRKCRSLNLAEEMSAVAGSRWSNARSVVCERKKSLRLSESETMLLLGLVKCEYDRLWGRWSESSWPDPETLAVWDRFVFRRELQSIVPPGAASKSKRL